MKLIVGLGNPGDKYQNTLHNAGFLAIDQLAEKLSVFNWTSKFKGLITQGTFNGERFILLKPQTYMNVSGESVQACMQFYKIELENVIVVSDDLDRGMGLLRYRTSGGHGGHNGIRDIIQRCGGNTFHRLRIGIGRPTGKMQVSDYVLSRPAGDVQHLFDDAISDTVGYLANFIEGAPVQIRPKK